MKLLTSNKLLGILIVGLLITFASPDALGQRRGRRVSHFDKKCEKFVNCHDARDGRWDGRGPDRRSRFSNIFRRNRRDRDFDNISRRRRIRDRDSDHHRWHRRR